MFQLKKSIRNNYIITAISFLFISFIGFLDYYSGSEISLLLGYLIPILLISFYEKSEKIMLIVNAVFAVFIWFIIDLYTREYSNVFNPVWSAIVRLSVFIIVGLLVLNLKEKYKNVVKLNEELKVLNDEKNKIIGVAAHDLRNPIGAISSFSDIILEDYSTSIDAKGLKMIEYIKDLSSNSLKLLEELLNISNIESGTIKLQKKSQNYIDFITKYSVFNSLIAKRKNISIQLETTEIELMVNFDEHYLSEVINNLLTNAIKFSKNDTEIKIVITKDKNTVKTEIIDQGQGIPKEEQLKLFNYFHKTSIQPTGGESSSGLGLAISKKIITVHNGTIGAFSELGKGANFYFEIPLK